MEEIGEWGKQADRTGDRRTADGRVAKVCCAEGAGGKLGRQSAGADGRRNLTAAGPKIREFRPEN